MDPLLFSCSVAAFLATLFLVPKWIRKAGAMGLAGGDMNKPGRPKVAEAGGITVIAGAVLGILVYVFLNTFYFSDLHNLVDIFAILATILLAGFIGFIDDILGWKSGMRHSTKVLSTIPIAIPLAVVNAGDSVMYLPLLGRMDMGFFFPLLIVPLGVIGATNGYNMLAGYNGLEAGMGVIILTVLGLTAWLSGAAWVAVLSLCVISALFAFLIYNRPPARVFPGDSLTYALGAAVACIAIAGNMEKMALILFAPYFFDAAMFVRFRFIGKRHKVEAFAKVNPDGSLGMPHDKIYDFTHLAIKVASRVKAKVYERDVVIFVLGTEALLGLAVFCVWYAGIL